MTVNSLNYLYPGNYQTGGSSTIQQGMQIANFASNLLSQIFGSMSASSDYSSESDTVTDKRLEQAPAKEEVQTEEPVESEEAVKNALKDSKIKFDTLPVDIKSDVIKKYETITRLARTNGTEVSDAELSRRLSNYVKALQAHEKELQMGQYYAEHMDENGEISPQDGAACDISIVDDDLVVAKSLKAGSKEWSEAMRNRGEGYVDMYDSNGDSVVDFDEIKSLEESDCGRELVDEEVQATQKIFDILDYNNDGSVDVKEMSSHLYALSRIREEIGTQESTSEDITFAEWHNFNHIAEEPESSPAKIYGVHQDLIYKNLKYYEDNPE